MIFHPPPPNLNASGSLPEVVGKLSAAIDAERRHAWEAPDQGLSITPDGRLTSGEEYEPSAFELPGFLALCARYSGRERPIAGATLALLTPATLAVVWAELYDPTAPRVPGIQVAERGASPAIYGVYPRGFPTGFDVAAAARAMLDALGGLDLPAVCLYDAAQSAVELHVTLPRYALRLTACDLYGAPAPTVLVLTRDGQVVGTPATAERRRRPGTGGETMAAGIAEKVAAAPTLARSRGLL